MNIIALALAVALTAACGKDNGTTGNSGNGGSGSGSGSGPDSGTPATEKTQEQARYEKFLMPAAEDAEGAVLAFPGAEGGGMYTTGGRGGKIIHVTKLTDDGSAGTFRHAVETTEGARTVVFDVAGRIELTKKLEIKYGDLTIAGQTAPGDGICISGYPIQVKPKNGNVIIRYMRFRLGDEFATDDSFDTIWGRYNDDIIIDHCSMSWSIDECCSFYANSRLTLQWCLVAESLNSSGKHSKANHGYGGIWGGKDASFHHNLLAHHNNRTPRFDHPEIYDETSLQTRRGNVDYRNNVNFNWGKSNGCYGGNAAHINMVGNYYKPGPESSDRHGFIQADGHYETSTKGSDGKKIWHTYDYPWLYLSGNVHTKYSDISSDNSKGIIWSTATNPTDGTVISNSGHILPAPLAINGADGKPACTSTHSAEDAFEAVCAWAGASLSRDAVDKRVASESKSGEITYKNGGNGSTGGIIDTQATVGGWPSYNATDAQLARVQDSDKDGMPDWFEEEFGLNKASAADGSAKTLDLKGRYTNFEMYLHYLVREVTAAQNEKGTYTKLQ